MPGNPCRDLEVAAVSQVLGDPGPAEAVGEDLGGEANLSGAALDHLERTQSRHRSVLERIAPPGLTAPEQRPAAIIADAGGGEVGVDVGLRDVVGGDDVVPPALLVEAEERAWALGVVVGDAKRDRGAHAREAVDEHAEEGAVAKADNRGDVDAVEKRPGLLRGEHWGLAGLDDVLRAAHRARGVEGHDLADDEPVEEHSERREVLLDARRRECPGELLDVGRDHHGLDLVEREASALAPLGEAPDRRKVREARVGVSDVGGEELPEAALGALGGGEEHRRREGTDDIRAEMHGKCSCLQSSSVLLANIRDSCSD